MSSRVVPLCALVLILAAPIASARDVTEEAVELAQDAGLWLGLDVAPLVAETRALAEDPTRAEAYVDREIYWSTRVVEEEAPVLVLETGDHWRIGLAPAHDEAREDDGASSDARSEGGFVAPVTRLAPVPTLVEGVAPRVDLDALTGPLPRLTPLLRPGDAAPAPAAPPAAPEPVARASAAPPTLAPVELAEISAAVVAASVAPAAGATATWSWTRLRRFALAAALYTRLARERILDHGSRERLLQAIRDHPGLAVADLAERTGTPRNTVTYHLRVLERERLVSSQRNGRHRLYFAPGSLERREQADALAALRHETSRAVALEIGQAPGVDQKALCARLGISPSLVHWHADRLVASGLVDKRREGRFVRYYPGASFDAVARSA